MLDFHTLCDRIHLNKSRLEKIGYKTKLCYPGYCYDEQVIMTILGQISTNLLWLISRFDNLDGDALVIHMRKNCIKGYGFDLCPGANNYRYVINQINGGKRQEAKARLVFISNQINIYLSSNKNASAFINTEA